MVLIVQTKLETRPRFYRRRSGKCESSCLLPRRFLVWTNKPPEEQGQGRGSRSCFDRVPVSAGFYPVHNVAIQGPMAIDSIQQRRRHRPAAGEWRDWRRLGPIDRSPMLRRMTQRTKAGKRKQRLLLLLWLLRVQPPGAPAKAHLVCLQVLRV